ncbi:glycine betaine ABC transporter substrate-binding protein [Nesterenkonia xinjiangensis]|uniref:ABC-type glycine betaine transport system substrate-binding domain-containing protein n=1 Tax=Nesterenkonia xinjiangensis TaxID=225327 RepID=A0A7Z0GJ06_9MICC|nr:glycine betaine ABC transporter substrate-binding protein [Nesterenkonia xinjiangensis]NYJ76885.1 hypothetical protein [Nesterenkonia xinjiangensis]
MTSPAVRSSALPAATLLALITLVAGCSGPPPAEEPTGEAAERAWTIAVPDHALDRAVAHIYSLALNSRETPAVVEIHDGGVGALASALTGEEDPGYDMVLARTLPLVDQLEHEGADGEADGEADGVEPGPAAQELVDAAETHLPGAQLLEPSAAVLSNALVITSVTAELHEIDLSAEADDPAFAAACDELRIGIRQDLPDPEPLLEELYDCEPEEVTAGTEGELLQQVITAEIDAAIITDSHPGIREHALVALTDAEQAFGEEQYVPVVVPGIAEDMPDIVDEVARRLDDEAMVTLRQLIDGEDGLGPQEAAEYWLVEEGLVAEPEDWG